MPHVPIYGRISRVAGIAGDEGYSAESDANHQAAVFDVDLRAFNAGVICIP
jgi:hypothetical protein